MRKGSGTGRSLGNREAFQSSELQAELASDQLGGRVVSHHLRGSRWDVITSLEKQEELCVSVLVVLTPHCHRYQGF